MKPKDLLEQLEKGDRTMDQLMGKTGPQQQLGIDTIAEHQRVIERFARQLTNHPVWGTNAFTASTPPASFGGQLRGGITQ